MNKTLTEFLDLAAAITLMTTAACINEDTIDGPVGMTRYDIVTFDGNRAGAEFTLTGPGDSGSRQLRAAASVDTSAVAPGQRVMIAYTDDVAAGEIILKGYSAVTNSPLRMASRNTIAARDGDPVYLLSMWRTGKWLNVHARISYTRLPRYWGFWADSATIDSATPLLHLVHKLPAGVSADSTFERRTYTSTDISALWDRPEVTGIRVVVNNSNLTKLDTITFNKTK